MKNTGKKAVVLGGTTPHIELILKLKKRGYEVLLVDYLENPPGRVYADRFFRESTLDEEKVLSIAGKESVNLVISACIDQANRTCAYVAQRLGLPHPYSYQTALDVTDKGRMKQIMKENGVPTSSFCIVHSASEVDRNEISFPAVVKPVDCNSSRGVRRVDSYEETLLRVQEDLLMSRTGEVIIEGFNEGPEIQVDCFAGKEKAFVLLTREKKAIPRDENAVLQSFGSILPAELSPSRIEEASVIADGIAKAFGLYNTPFFYQAVITEDGIRVLEFAPRIGGGLSSYLLKTIIGYDAVDAVIDSFLGREVSLQVKLPQKVYSTNLLYTRSGVFDHLEGLSELKEEGIIREFFVYKSSGTKMDGDLRSGNRVGAFIVEANEYGELYEKERAAFLRVEAFDEIGSPMLRRDLTGEGWVAPFTK